MVTHHNSFAIIIGWSQWLLTELQVSFVQGDIIVDVQLNKDIWMSGTVQRTGMSGLFPSTFVQLVT